MDAMSQDDVALALDAARIAAVLRQQRQSNSTVQSRAPNLNTGRKQPSQKQAQQMRYIPAHAAGVKARGPRGSVTAGLVARPAITYGNGLYAPYQAPPRRATAAKETASLECRPSSTSTEIASPSGSHPRRSGGFASVARRAAGRMSISIFGGRPGSVIGGTFKTASGKGSSQKSLGRATAKEAASSSSEEDDDDEEDDYEFKERAAERAREFTAQLRESINAALQNNALVASFLTGLSSMIYAEPPGEHLCWYNASDPDRQPEDDPYYINNILRDFAYVSICCFIMSVVLSILLATDLDGVPDHLLLVHLKNVRFIHSLPMFATMLGTTVMAMGYGIDLGTRRCASNLRLQPPYCRSSFVLRDVPLVIIFPSCGTGERNGCTHMIASLTCVSALVLSYILLQLLLRGNRRKLNRYLQRNDAGPAAIHDSVMADPDATPAAKRLARKRKQDLKMVSLMKNDGAEYGGQLKLGYAIFATWGDRIPKRFNPRRQHLHPLHPRGMLHPLGILEREDGSWIDPWAYASGLSHCPHLPLRSFTESQLWRVCIVCGTGMTPRMTLRHSPTPTP